MFLASYSFPADSLITVFFPDRLLSSALDAMGNLPSSALTAPRPSTTLDSYVEELGRDVIYVKRCLRLFPLPLADEVELTPRLAFLPSYNSRRRNPVSVPLASSKRSRLNIKMGLSSSRFSSSQIRL
jgi:hypothetical protein